MSYEKEFQLIFKLFWKIFREPSHDFGKHLKTASVGFGIIQQMVVLMFISLRQNQLAFEKGKWRPAEI